MSTHVPLIPTQTYTSIVLYGPHQEIIWKYPRHDTGEYVAGCVVALHNILPPNKYLLKVGNGPQFNPIVAAHMLEQFLTFQEIDISEIRHYPVEAPYFGWWIQARETYTYNLYKFLTIDFTEGFINTCKSFDIDFRTYIHAPPFQEGIYYDITGYDIRVPSTEAVEDASGIPPYTGSYENANRDKN